MADTSTRSSNLRWFVIACAVLGIAGIAFGTSPQWWPAVQDRFATLAQGDPPAEQHPPHDDINVLTLSENARQTLDITTAVLKSQPYSEVLRIPGHTVVVPGTGRLEVTAPASGEIASITAAEGSQVSPGQALMSLTLIHDEGIKVQLELLDALAEQEFVAAEVKRLEQLERNSPGAVAGTKLLQQKYQLRHLEHTIASRRQMLILLGLSEAKIDELIAHHREHGQQLSSDHPRDNTTPLLKHVTITAPKSGSQADEPARYIVEHLSVVLGEHVEAGTKLCQLGDYRKLYIEGNAFERDLEAIRTALDNGWLVSATLERRGEGRELIENLRLAYIAAEVDAEARSARFYVELPNQLRKPADESAAGLDWAYRPGQRMELQVPLKQMGSSLVVPTEAVARDGLDNYIFVVNNNRFTRLPVTILHQDEERVVIAEDDMITTGVRVATSGAYQLQLALKNLAAGPVNAHGHAH